jgi:hypothetical protein
VPTKLTFTGPESLGSFCSDRLAVSLIRSAIFNNRSRVLIRKMYAPLSPDRRGTNRRHRADGRVHCQHPGLTKMIDRGHGLSCLRHEGGSAVTTEEM